MKAILVIDIPNEYTLEELKANILVTHKGNWLYKRHRQKLKELPQKWIGKEKAKCKSSYDSADMMDAYTDGLMRGYNKCLEELEEEREKK